MSSSSSYEPDEDSDFETNAAPERRSSRRQTRSSSRIASLTVSLSESSGEEELGAGAASGADPEAVSDAVLEAESEAESETGSETQSEADAEPDPSDERLEELAARLKTLPPDSAEAYNKLLDEIEKDITFARVDEDAEILNVTQYGAVIWTATEKEAFFNHLDRKGENGIREVAAAIGTKSELEVMDYIDRLKQGLESSHVESHHNDTIIMADMPAAAEISEACCDRLDEYADMLRLTEDVSDRSRGTKRYGKNWLIDHKRAQELVEAEVNDPLRGGIHIAANLLHAPTWIMLSRLFFMNTGGTRLDENWRNIRKTPDESPSLTGEALMDFLALTMSITRRLVHSALFLAEARLRSTKQLDRDDIGTTVRKSDVSAAIDVLGMNHHRSDFVLEFVRRNGIRIVDVRHRKGYKQQALSYDEAERILNRDDPDSHHPGNVMSHTGSEDDEEESDDEDDADYDGDYDEEEMETEDPAQRSEEPVPLPVAKSEEQPQSQQPQPPPPDEPNTQGQGQAPPPPRPRRYSEHSYQSTSEEERASDAEEEHADFIDSEHNRLEELKLWQMLQQPIPPHLLEPRIREADLEEDAETRPSVIRKTKQEMIGWRQRTLYRNEWEEYGHGVSDLHDDLAENRRKRRRIAEVKALWGSEGAEDGDEAVFEDEEDAEDEGQEKIEPLSAEVVDSEDETGDPMDVDVNSASATRPAVSVELPTYGSEAWSAFMKSLTSSEAKPAM